MFTLSTTAVPSEDLVVEYIQFKVKASLNEKHEKDSHEEMLLHFDRAIYDDVMSHFTGEPSPTGSSTETVPSSSASHEAHQLVNL